MQQMERAMTNLLFLPSTRMLAKVYDHARHGYARGGKSLSSTRHAALVVIPLLLVVLAGEAWGCPTCKDGVIASDDAASNVARGYFYSILLMLAMPFTLASCFGLYVWREYRRQQRAGVFDQVPGLATAAMPRATTAGASVPTSGTPVAVGSHAS